MASKNQPKEAIYQSVLENSGKDNEADDSFIDKDSSTIIADNVSRNP